LKRRISVLIASLFVVGALSSATPANAAEAACADPNCPWSPVTMFVKDTLWWVERNVNDLCDRAVDNCPL
jgi:hypothetical protein